MLFDVFCSSFWLQCLEDVLSVWMFWATFGTDLVLFGYLWMWFLRSRYFSDTHF